VTLPPEPLQADQQQGDPVLEYDWKGISLLLQVCSGQALRRFVVHMQYDNDHGTEEAWYH